MIEICHKHPGAVVSYDRYKCPICEDLEAKNEVITALSKLSEEEAEELEFLDTGRIPASKDNQA
jgi:hypothetical protein